MSLKLQGGPELLILHGALFRDRFLIWAESADALHAHNAQNSAAVSHVVDQDRALIVRAEAADELKPQSENCQFDGAPVLHRGEPKSLSFAASADELKQALDAASISVEDTSIEQIVAWMPEANGVPLASSSIIGRSLEDADQSSLTKGPWLVPAFPLPMTDLVDLLCWCVDGKPIGPGIMPGQDMRFWAFAMRFTAALVARQQFLPGLSLTRLGCFASWEPVFLGPDGEMLAKLARNMPGVCLACEGDPGELEHNRASELLIGFLGQLTDFLVRSEPDRQIFPTETSGPDLLTETSRTISNIHQRWLDALIGPEAKVEATDQEIAKLSSQIAEWRRPVEVASDSPFRLCLRLEEPLRSDSDAPGAALSSGQVGSSEHDAYDGDDCDDEKANASDRRNLDAWHVRFLLQSVREPALLFPVETVLSESFADLPLLRGGKVSAREYLYRSLGQAARLCPDIERSFADAHPKGFSLDTPSAYEFLAKITPLLKNAGFSVQLPSWWSEKKKISAKARVFSSATAGGALFGLKTIAQFDWEMALGGQPISIEELEKLAQLNIPLLRWQGLWVELNPETLAPVLAFFRKNASTQRLSGQNLLKLALAQPALPEGVVFDGISGEGPIVDLVQKLQTQTDFEELPVDRRFNGELRPYQARGMSWLSFLKDVGLGACLADDMGLGKTVQTLAFIQRSWHAHKAKDRRPSLLVCPTTVIGNWQKEAAKFTPDLKVVLHYGLDRPSGKAFVKAANDSAIVVTSYALLQRDLDYIKKVSWETIVLDEAQNIKNPETRQAIAACSLHSEFRMALTGTPVENSVGDLWSIMNFLNPGFLGKNTDFKTHFLKPIQVFQNQEKIQQLRRLTGPFILRRLKTDKTIVADLPEKFERKTRCHLTKEQASIYAAIVEEATGSLDQTSGFKRKSLVLTTLLRLKQICDHPVLVQNERVGRGIRSGKLKRLTEMLEAIDTNHEKALVFTQFTEMGRIIQSHLQNITGKEVSFLHGGTSRKDRDSMVERFQRSDSGPSIFVLSLKAGGTGLNLTRANHVFHFDRWWNPAVENQATDRAFRLGQEKNVSVHKFICAGTLEEHIDEIIERKKVLASNTVGSGEGWLTELSTAELRDIFALKDLVLID